MAGSHEWSQRLRDMAVESNPMMKNRGYSRFAMQR